MDTAALIECLDLVITVDTAVAHLAGAMGKPVWVICQRDASSWHFMCWRPRAPWNERSPWYPTARIFRQHEFNRPHFWDDVIEDVSNALREGISVAAE
jgi:ADP-heptose:LPS heptosyltransferase